MMRLSPTYRDKFEEFSAAMAGGVPTEKALREIYGKTAPQFGDDARAWYRQRKFPTEMLKPPGEVNQKVESRKIPVIEQELARLTIAVSGPARPQAAREYARLSKLAGSRRSGRWWLATRSRRNWRASRGGSAILSFDDDPG
ncbi:MAG: hypothetical protein FJW20_06230 [Acidimicrobiia bacterium]|nr:hypothetical protein [Acidimicrobiia bacterium]